MPRMDMALFMLEGNGRSTFRHRRRKSPALSEQGFFDGAETAFGSHGKEISAVILPQLNAKTGTAKGFF